jgi:hypothetical protein
MLLLKIYLIMLEVQLVLQIIAWLACNEAVKAARTNKFTSLTNYCCMILTIAKISPEECVHIVDDPKYNMYAVSSIILWPITLPIGIWNYTHE